MYTHTAELPVVAGTSRRANSLSSELASPFGAMLLLAIVALAAMAWRTRVETARPVVDGATPAPIVASLGDRPSHGRRYRAEVTAVSSLQVGATQQWIVRLSGRGHRRLTGAHVTARAWMPDDSTLPPVPATATYVGGGRYRLEGIHFARAGWWNVALVVDGRRGVDSVAFNVVIR